MGNSFLDSCSVIPLLGAGTPFPQAFFGFTPLEILSPSLCIIFLFFPGLTGDSESIGARRLAGVLVGARDEKNRVDTNV